jgi:hypothetical protein
VGATGVGSTAGVDGVEGVEGVEGVDGVLGVVCAATIIAVASESFVIVPIELVAVTSTLMYLSTSLEPRVYVALVAPEMFVHVVSSSGSVQRFH